MWYADPGEAAAFSTLPDCEVEGCHYEATRVHVRPAPGLMMKSGTVTLLRSDPLILCPWHERMLRESAVAEFYREPDGTFGRCSVNGCGAVALILQHDPVYWRVRRGRPLCEPHAGSVAERPDYRRPDRDEAVLDRLAGTLMAAYNAENGSRISA